LKSLKGAIVVPPGTGAQDQERVGLFLGACGIVPQGADRRERIVGRTRLSLQEDLVNRLAFAVALALSSSNVLAQPVDDTKAIPSCPHCGMDREKFAATRMVIDYDDGKPVGLCSIHCAAVDLAVVIDRTPTAIWVADLPSKKLVNAETAVWVIGGSKPGVMTSRGKWAFADKGAAEAFAKENGGTIAGFEDAIKAAYEDMYKDNKAIREKRKMMKAKAAQKPN
jgi:copper chaperone NosL